MSTNLLPACQFYGHSLELVDHDGEPFVIMKTVVERMGLSWSPQRRKLSASANRLGVINLITPTSGGAQEAVCMPLRKLPGFLMSIEPRKVAADVRPVVELFQSECDDALWAYWKAKAAARTAAVLPAPLAPETVAVSKDRYIELLEVENQLLRGRRRPKTKPKPVTEEEAEKLKALRRQGLSLAEIAKITGRNKATISFLVRDVT